MATKSETARANGAKSRDPATAAGRQKSSRNSMSHGLTARNTLILQYENPEDFQKMLAEYYETYSPATAAEKDLVDQMIAARWRIRRLWTIETALLDSEILRREPEADLDPALELAQAFKSLADDSRALHLISRYESRLYRIHNQAYADLRELQNKKYQTNPSHDPQPHFQGHPTPQIQPSPLSETSDTVGRDCIPQADFQSASPSATTATPDPTSSPTPPTYSAPHPETPPPTTVSFPAPKTSHPARERSYPPPRRFRNPAGARRRQAPIPSTAPSQARAAALFLCPPARLASLR